MTYIPRAKPYVLDLNPVESVESLKELPSILSEGDFMLAQLYQDIGLVAAVANAPASGTISGGQALTAVNDTNVSATLTGTPLTALLQAVTLTLGWIGQLSLARGGTGKDFSGATDGQIPIGKSSDHSLNLATLTAGTGIAITNAGGAITIAASGGGGGQTTCPLTNGDNIDPEMVFDHLGDGIMCDF